MQTNSDHWQDGCKDRCAAATDRIQEVGQASINSASLKEVMYSFPTMNSITVFHSSLVARDSIIASEGTKYNGTETDGTSKYKNDIPKNVIKQASQDL